MYAYTAYMHTYPINTCTQYMHLWIYTYIRHVCIHICITYTHIYMALHDSVSLSTYFSLSLYIYMYMHTYVQREGYRAHICMYPFFP